MNESTRKPGPLARLLLTLSPAALLSGCCSGPASDTKNPLSVVDQVDLKRYQGTWYEIARYDHRFERGCEGVTATYTLRPDGMVTVVNRCRKGSPAGKERSIEGKAWVADKRTNAKLLVRFFWPFCGDYWIIELGRDYDYAVVGHPNRRYLWILARSPRMDEALYRSVLSRLPGRGFDPSRLYRVRH